MQARAEKPRVLIVDDEHTIADTLALIFENSGFEATACYSGERALDLATTQQFDFLISDVYMGELNGVETAIAIRLLQPGCRILLVSGHSATAEILQSAKEKGHTFEILAKPVHPTQLFETLTALPRCLANAAAYGFAGSSQTD